jgi:hypothetical protein
LNFNWLNREKPFGMMMGVLLMPVIQQAAPFFTVGILQSIQERITFPMIQAEIDSFRFLPDSVKCTPQISNTIAGWNARIQHEHEANRHLWSDAFSTDRWNSVEPIPLPCELQVTLKTAVK